jgi:hypothetical protein
LKAAMSGPISDENEAITKEKAALIEILLKQDEIYWQQRSRVNWLQHGDQNTSFIHNFASARRKKNYIKKLENNDGDWVEGTEHLKPIVFHYFSNLFLSEVDQVDPIMMEKILPKIIEKLLPFLG